MNPQNLTTLTQVAPPAIVIAVTVGIIQIIKVADTSNKFSSFYPAFSFLIALVLGVFVFNLDGMTALITALSPSGGFDLVKNSVVTPLSQLSLKQSLVTEPTLPAPPPMGATAAFTHADPPASPTDAPTVLPT